MKKYRIQIIAIVVSIVLIGVALFVELKPQIAKPSVDKVLEERKEYFPIKENSPIIEDGEYVFYTSEEGNLMRLHAFETTPEIWLEHRTPLDVDNTHILLTDGKVIAIFNKEEKGIEEGYDVKTENAEFTQDAIYYKDYSTGKLMKVRRGTSEKEVIIDDKIKKFVVYNDSIMYVLENDDYGIKSCDFDGNAKETYAENVRIADFVVTEYCIYYNDAEDDFQMKTFIFKENKYNTVEKIKGEEFCFSKGVFFIKEKTDEGYSLVADYRYEHR